MEPHTPNRNAITTLTFTPFKLKTASVPSSARLYRAIPLGEDLRNELEGGTIQEPSLPHPGSDHSSPHYVLHFYTYLQQLEETHQLPSLADLHVENSRGEKTYLYDQQLGGWQPSHLPDILRLSSGAAGTCGRRGGQMRIEDRSAEWRPATLTAIQRRMSGKRRVTVTRRVPEGINAEETEEGIYIPIAGSEETRTAEWLNLIFTALRLSQASNSLAGPQTRAKAREIADKRRTWSAEFATKPMPTDLDIRMKPDIALLQKDPFDPYSSDSWRNVVSILELSSSSDTSRITKQLTRKACAIFVAQPGRRFIIALSISHTHFRLHVFDRAGAIHSESRAYCIHRNATYLLSALYALALAPPELVGYDPTIHYSSISERTIRPRTRPTIQVGDTTYTIIVRLLFSGDSIRGRATLCFVVSEAAEKQTKKHRKTIQKTGPPKLYVVKSSWARVGRTTTEEQMLLRIKERGLKHGVPILVKAWTVQINGITDSTALRRPDYLQRYLGSDESPEVRIHRRILMEPVGFPLESFSCIQELLSVVIDIVDVHEQLVTRCNILHRDVSIKNTMTYIHHHRIDPWPVQSNDENLLGRLSERETIIQENGFRRGLLIDYDYSKFTDEESDISEGQRTGTIPFMAVEILRTFATVVPNINITHQPAHDLESIVYVLVWICVLYSGPSSAEILPLNAQDTYLKGWASCKTHDDVERLWSMKTGELVTEVPIEHFTPYFEGLKKHVSKLYRMIATKSLDYQAIREVLLDAFFEVQEPIPIHARGLKKPSVPAKREMKPVVEIRTTKRSRHG